jgi:hypothetical protein
MPLRKKRDTIDYSEGKVGHHSVLECNSVLE